MKHSVERLDREVHSAVQISQIGQLYTERFVHGREMEEGVRLHTILVQCGAGPGQPGVAVWPPEGVV